MDVISLCLPVISDQYSNFSWWDLIMWKCLKTGGSHNICGSIWKYSFFFMLHFIHIYVEVDMRETAS